MLVRDILTRKGGQILSLPDTATALEAAKAMQSRQVGSIALHTPAGSIVGLIDERAVVAVIADRRGEIEDLPAVEIATTPVPTIDAATTIVDGFAAMTRHRQRHFVVIDDGQAIGLISIGDLVKAYTSDIELENLVLRDLATAHIAVRDVLIRV